MRSIIIALLMLAVEAARAQAPAYLVDPKAGLKGNVWSSVSRAWLDAQKVPGSDVSCGGSDKAIKVRAVGAPVETYFNGERVYFFRGEEIGDLRRGQLLLASPSSFLAAGEAIEAANVAWTDGNRIVCIGHAPE